MRQRSLTRRALLQGAGVTLALPFLPSLGWRAFGRGEAPVRPPTRFAFIYLPNGVVQDAWYPRETGANYALPPALQSLAPHRADLTVITGMERTFAGGTGVHAQCGACWLTSSPPDQPLDGGFPTNISLDQMLARQVGRETLLPSLELSCNDHANNKETRYFETISWLGPGYAAGVEKNPREVFRRLYGDPAGDPLYRSVLDVIRADAGSLRRKLGRTDQGRLDEFLDSVRATETRIQNAERARARVGTPPIAEPAGIPGHRGDYLQLMGDLMLLAFQQDLTRVATLVIDPERWDTPRMYHGVFDQPRNHHVLTHTKGEEARETLRKIDRFHMDQYARLVGKLGQIREGEGTLLDHCAFCIGSGLGDGNRHDYGNLPLIIAGGAGGRLKTGLHLNPRHQPLANLWLSLLHVAGGREERFADSTGPFKDILQSV